MNRRRFLSLSLCGAYLNASDWRPWAISAELAAGLRLAPGQARALPPGGLLGIDGLLVNESHPWVNLIGLQTAFQNSGLSLLRYPGRNVADAWDWENGWLDPNAKLIPYLTPTQEQLQKIRSIKYPLSDLQALDCRVIFTPSLAYHNLRLCDDPSAAPLAAAEPALEHTRNALVDANQRNIPIDWIELGDGLSDTPFWQGSLGQKLLGGSTAEPYSAYPAIAACWSEALHGVRPSARIAFHGASFLTPPVDPLLAQWNRHAWQTLAPNSAVEAMAVQLFLPASLGVPLVGSGALYGTPEEQIAQFRALHDPQILAGLFVSAAGLLDRYLASGGGAGMSDTRFQLIISAFNLADPIGVLRHTWAHGLAIAALLNSFLREPRVVLAVLHNLTDPPHAAFLQTSGQFNSLQLPETDLDPARLQASLEPFTLGPAGRVASLFSSLMTGMEAAIPFGAEDSANPLVWGWLFTNGSGSRANLLLANLTGEPVWVNWPTFFQALPFHPDDSSLTTWQAQPTQFITGANRSAYPEFSLTISQHSIAPDGLMALPPYSLTTVWQLTAQRSGKFFLHLPTIQSWRSP